MSGLTPLQANDPVTQPIMEGIAALWSFLPGRTYTGSYTRAGLSTFGLVYRDGDSLVNHAYGSIHGADQWVVVSMPKPGWMAEADDDWGIREVGPMPFVLRLGLKSQTAVCIDPCVAETASRSGERLFHRRKNMDLRTGQLFETREAALEAGVPESDIAEIVRNDDAIPEVRFVNVCNVPATTVTV